MNIPEIWTKVWNGLSNKEWEGYSVTKMVVALFATFCVVIAGVYTNAMNLEMVLTIFIGAIFTLSVKKSVEIVQKSKSKPEDPHGKPEDTV